MDYSTSPFLVELFSQTNHHILKNVWKNEVRLMLFAPPAPLIWNVVIFGELRPCLPKRARRSNGHTSAFINPASSSPHNYPLKNGRRWGCEEWLIMTSSGKSVLEKYHTDMSKQPFPLYCIICNVCFWKNQPIPINTHKWCCPISKECFATKLI